MDISSILAALPAKWTTVILALCGLCAVFIAFAPAPTSATSTYGRIWRIINALAMNVHNGKSLNHPAVQEKINSDLAAPQKVGEK
jgi:hypothetical protein